jgi:hypothetical protein
MCRHTGPGNGNEELSGGRKSRLQGGWEGAKETFTRIGEASVVWRYVLQCQGVIKLTEGGTYRDQIMLEYNNRVKVYGGVLSDGSLDFPFAVFSRPPGLKLYER